MNSTLTPVGLKHQRRQKSAAAMDAFCSDLAEMCGRPDRDALTEEIYRAVREARERGDEVEGLVEDPAWLHEAPQTVRVLAEKVPRRVKDRIDDTRDPEVARCLERARAFYDPYEVAPGVVELLAACLLDFAFVRIDESRLDEPETGGGPLVAVAPDSSALVEMRSHMMLGRTVRWGLTVLAALGILVTGQLWLIPMALVGWLAAWILTDKKAIQQASDKGVLVEAKTEERKDFSKEQWLEWVAASRDAEASEPKDTIGHRAFSSSRRSDPGS